MGNLYQRKLYYPVRVFCTSVVIFFFYAFRSKTNALNICQKMIEMFVRTKHKIDKRHEFALVVVNDDALWVSTETF